MRRVFMCRDSEEEIIQDAPSWALIWVKIGSGWLIFDGIMAYRVWRNEIYQSN